MLVVFKWGINGHNELRPLCEIYRAKAQRKLLETRQRFAPLRLCVRNLLPAGICRAKFFYTKRFVK
jgi:hypothetical protein